MKQLRDYVSSDGRKGKVYKGTDEDGTVGYTFEGYDINDTCGNVMANNYEEATYAFECSDEYAIPRA